MAAFVLAGCGDGGGTEEAAPATAAVEACASRAATANAAGDTAVSCDKGVLQYQSKAALPVITARGPWLAQGKATTGPGEEGLDFGGGGGSPSTVLCPTILGARGRSGSLIDALSFTCQAGGSVFSVGPFGGNGGGPFVLQCPSGFFAIGVQGGSGSLIDRLGFVCGNSAGQRTTTAVVGGGGGSPFYFECAPSQKLVGFGVRSGSLIDNLQPFCGPR